MKSRIIGYGLMLPEAEETEMTIVVKNIYTEHTDLTMLVLEFEQ